MLHSEDLIGADLMKKMPVPRSRSRPFKRAKRIAKNFWFRAAAAATAAAAAGSVLLANAASEVREVQAAAIPTYSYIVVNRFPHDRSAFTQGLIFKDGFLYESTGLVGQSSIRQARLETGEIVRRMSLPPLVFGEGLARRGNELLVLTWTSRTGYVIDLPTLTTKSTFHYPGEGWGLADAPGAIFMSDGTSELRVLDPKTLRERHRIRVTSDGVPIDRLNELEWVDGEIFANVWQSDLIARIDPTSGRVTGWIDLSQLLSRFGEDSAGADVLNGIAYDPKDRRLFVTGKLWPNVFEIRLLNRDGL